MSRECLKKYRALNKKSQFNDLLNEIFGFDPGQKEKGTGENACSEAS